MEQAAFVAGFLGGVIGGAFVLLGYITYARAIQRYMIKKRRAVQQQEMNRRQHLMNLEKQKAKERNWKRMQEAENKKREANNEKS